MLIYNKLKLIRKLLALSQVEIQREAGLNQSDISQLENGKKKFIPTAYIQYLNKIGVPLDALFDDNLSLSSFEAKFNLPLSSGGNKNHSDTSGAPFVSAPGHETPPVQINLPANVDDDFVRIPIVDVSVAAGNGYYNPHYIEEVECISMPRALIKDGCIYLCVRTKGHSMTPSILDGGYLVVRLMDRCEWGDIRDNYVYVVSDRDGKAYVKRLKNRLRQHGFIVCMSDNADKQNYPNFNIYNDELNTVWFAEWYFTAKIPNIQETFYRKQSEFEDRLDELEAQYQKLAKVIELKDRP